MAPPLTDLIRQKLDDGTLPRDEPAKAWEAYGSLLPCDACGTRVLRRQIEYSFTIGSKFFRFHAPCYEVWGTERRRQGAGHTARAIVEGGGVTCIDCLARKLRVPSESVADRLLRLQQNIAVESTIGRCRRCGAVALVLRI